MLSNKAYDVLKYMATIVLPAAGALYCALAALWDLPFAQEIVGTLSAIAAFIGALLKISSTQYAGDGTLNVIQTLAGNEYKLELNDPLDTPADGDTIMLKVNNP